MRRIKIIHSAQVKHGGSLQSKGNGELAAVCPGGLEGIRKQLANTGRQVLIALLLAGRHRTEAQQEESSTVWIFLDLVLTFTGFLTGIIKDSRREMFWINV